MTTARYPIHRMIQDLLRDPQRHAAFAADPEPVFAEYGLTDAEKALLRDGSPAALHELGVHPNLQMKLRRLSRPPAPAGPGPLAPYFDRLMER